MNAGLVWLLRHGPRSRIRSLTRRTRGAKGVLLAVGVVAVLAVLVAGQVPEWTRRAADPDAFAVQLETTRVAAPLVLTLLLVLMDLSGRGLYFRPAEIDFLFPAPVSRADLLLYQLVTRAGVSLLSGLWTAIFVVRWAGTVAGGIAAAALTMVFLQLASQAGSLALAALGARAAPRVRWAFWGVVLALAAVGARSALASIPEGADGAEAFATFASSPWVVAATAPTQPFARLFTAASVPDALLWLGACLAELGVLTLVILGLDVAYEESAIASSRRVQERLRRMRSGEGAFLPTASRARRRRVPALPRFGGAGPVARRQFLELVRNPSSVVWTGVSILFCTAVIVGVGRHQGATESTALPVAALAAALGLTTFANQGFTFDFRRDLDRMAEWKLLPIPAAALAAGQLVTATVVFSLIQGLAVALVIALGGAPAWVPGVALLVLPPWNWLSAAIDNALFLWFPYRIAPEDTARVPFVGRMMLTMLLKGLAVGAVVALVAVPTAAGFALGGAFTWIGAGVGFLLLVASAALSTLLVASAFRDYDVSRDV